MRPTRDVYAQRCGFRTKDFQSSKDYQNPVGFFKKNPRSSQSRIESELFGSGGLGDCVPPRFDLPGSPEGELCYTMRVVDSSAADGSDGPFDSVKP